MTLTPSIRDPRVRLGAVALALAGLGAALGLVHAPGGAALAFSAATVAALGTRVGIALGALALLAGLGTPPVAQPTLALPALGTALAGLGLGLFARELERARALPTTAAAAALLALFAALALALPDGRALLAGSDGAPLMLPALIVDGPSFTTLPRLLPAELSLPAAPGWLELAALAFSGLAAASLVAAQLRPNERTTSLAWRLAMVAALLTLVVALVGAAQLLGSVSLDGEALRRAYDLAASRDGAVLDLVAPRAAELRLWSRPWVDGLRLLPAAGLLWLALRQRERDSARVAPALGPLTPAALALTALGAALIAAAHGMSGAPLALVAGLVLAAGTLISRAWGPVAATHVVDVPLATAPASLANISSIALVGAATCWVYAWLVSPLFGA